MPSVDLKERLRQQPISNLGIEYSNGGSAANLADCTKAKEPAQAMLRILQTNVAYVSGLTLFESAVAFISSRVNEILRASRMNVRTYGINLVAFHITRITAPEEVISATAKSRMEAERLVAINDAKRQIDPIVMEHVEKLANSKANVDKE